MYPQSLGNLFTHCHRWIETGHGILEDHADLATADFTHSTLRHIKEDSVLEEHAAASILAWQLVNKTHNRESSHAVPATALAYNTHLLDLLYRKTHAINRT